jgi:hypothetical protein
VSVAWQENRKKELNILWSNILQFKNSSEKYELLELNSTQDKQLKIFI